MHADLIVIVAKLAQIPLEEVVVGDAGSQQDKDLLKRAPLATYPMLELADG